MTVLVLVDAPAGLRGHVTRWLCEVVAGVYVGSVSSRVRDRLWSVVIERLGTGQAILIFRAQNEQGYDVRSAGVERWEPVDMDELILMGRQRR